MVLLLQRNINSSIEKLKRNEFNISIHSGFFDSFSKRLVYQCMIPPILTIGDDVLHLDAAQLIRIWIEMDCSFSDYLCSNSRF
jgi:hypothetical protein